MTRGRVRDKTYTGYNGVATDALRALDKLRKTPEGRFGRVAAPFQEQLRVFIDADRCPWCDGGPYRNLAGHTHRAHAVSAAELRELAGLTKYAPLCSAELSQRHADLHRGKRLPDSAYDRANHKPRTFSEAGLTAQRAKLDSARSPEQARTAGMASAQRTAERNAEKYAQAIRLFGEGMLLQDIATAVGMHPRYVRNALRRAGLIHGDARGLRSRNPEFRRQQEESRQAALAAQRERREAESRQRVERFRELGSDWDAVGACAAEWGVTRKTAAGYLRRHGATVPDGRAS